MDMKNYGKVYFHEERVESLYSICGIAIRHVKKQAKSTTSINMHHCKIFFDSTAY